MINCLFSMKQKHIKREKRTSAVKQQQQKSREKKTLRKMWNIQ